MKKQIVPLLEVIQQIIPVAVLAWRPSPDFAMFPTIKLPIVNGTSVGQFLNFFFFGKPCLDPAERECQQAEISNARVLLVEDNVMNQRILKRILNSIGYNNVSVATNGTTAVELVDKDETFDIILMDIMMPGKSGIEATQEIRRLPAVKQPRAIIGVTADVATDTPKRCLEVGMQDCVTKPVNHEVLKKRMDKYFRK